LVSEKKNFSELSKERVLDNVELAEWLRELEDRIHKLES
jgi:hypothetical protein